MNVSKTQVSPTKVELIVVADQAFLSKIKDHVLSDLAKTVSVSGFRKGHAPKAIVEKNVNPENLQRQFLEHAVNDLYAEAVNTEKLRVVAQPEIGITKFVPFEVLEFKAEVEVVGNITLPDYKAIKMNKQVDPVTEKEVTAVLDDLRRRDSVKSEVQRPAKNGDEVVIDFTGVDAKDKKPISGGSGNDYPLVLGSNAFIPGFEPQIVGMKPGEEKTIDVTFPDDYGAKELQKKKATFTVKIKAIREVELAKLDDAFAAKVGPFKTVTELKADIKKQLLAEKDSQAQRTLENDLLAEIAEKAKAEIPDILIEDEVNQMEEEERRNLTYRGQTWQEHLKAEGKTDKEHREGLRATAEARVKTGLVLGEVAEAEKITIHNDDVNERVKQLKAQYNDNKMRAELDKPENRREITSRLLTEKTIERLVSYATAN
ncbi:MAG TPA: trigger factor [Verrucomicrobiae bacterium]|nr:trigger factor [Verrucomicrobiae bacterium]